MNIPNPYEGDYRTLLILPILLVLVSLFFIPQIPKGIELKGGVLITIQSGEKNPSILKLEEGLVGMGVHEYSISTFDNPVGSVTEVQLEQQENLANAEQAIRSFYSSYEDASRREPYVQNLERLSQGVGTDADEARALLPGERAAFESSKQDVLSKANLILSDCESIIGPVQRDFLTMQGVERTVSNCYSKAKDSYRQQLLDVVNSSISYSSYSFSDVSPTLSEYFLQKALYVVIVSALLSMVAVLFIFRSFVPSLLVLTGAAADIIIAMGAMGLFGIPLTLASFAALLMLIGFSLDTDILLTIRVLKRGEGTARHRAYETMKTGATLSLSAITAFSALFILSMFMHIPTYYQISAVAIFGLIGDLVATWLFNAPLVLYFIEKKGAH